MIDPVEFGELKGQVALLAASEQKNRELLEEMNRTLTTVQLQLAEARGGWKTLMLFGGASASIGGVVTTWVLQHFKWGS